MLNTRKLLFILPDVAYIAELLPTKKEHTFAIQAFRQINGEFMTEDDDFITENIEKLFSKIEPETYHLVLPDFLFTNTILEIKETQESKVKQYIKDELLPSLELSKDTHEIETFILTQYGNLTKIQLTALEKEVVAPIAQSAANHHVEIENISPISWTIKSVISLEPSISVIQIGSMLYVAEHYIGVDQCTMAKTDEIENVSETIKTLKGAQPSIQTIYLMANALVEEKLKELVSSTLPIQQLATFKEEETQMPSYVKQIIESSMKTLDIPDYPVPAFSLPKAEAAKMTIPTSTPEKPRPLDVFEEVQSDKPDSETEALVKPALKVEVEEAEPDSEPEALPAPTPVPQLEEPDDVPSALSAPAPIPALETGEELTEDEVELENFKPVKEPLDEAPILMDTEDEKAVPEREVEDIKAETPPPKPMTEVQPPPRPEVIKNKAGAGSWLKMLLIMISVFAVTVAVGVGIGLVVLNLTSQPEPEVATATPTPVASAEPSPVASPSPSPSSVAINKEELSILVVNATTKAGYAGGTRSKLEAADYGTVRAANARGEYDPGLYVLMPEENQALIDTLSADSELDLTYDTGYATEDPQSQYDAVVVLAE